MKFTKITSALAFAGAVTAVAIPRDTTVSITIESTLIQLNSLLNEMKPAVSNLANEADAANVDLISLQSQLSDIKSQLSALTPSSSKRANTLYLATAPVADAVPPVSNDESTTTKRDIVSDTIPNDTSVLSSPVSTVSQLAPLASSFCSGVENNVPLRQSVSEITTLTEGISLYLHVPLSLLQLPGSI